MAKSNWNIGNFLAEVSSKGLAKPCRFAVDIDIPACVRGNVIGKQVSMFCDQAILPYSRVLTSRQQLFGPPSMHPVGVDYNGEGVSLQFYVDKDMNVKRFFDAWADGIIDRRTYTARYQFSGSVSNYLTSLYVSQLDEADNITYKVKLIDAYPVSVQALVLDGGATNQVHKLSVNFVFRKWEEVAVSGQARPEETKSSPLGNIGIVNGNIDFSIGPNFGGGYAGNQVEPSGGGWAGYTDSYFITR